MPQAMKSLMDQYIKEVRNIYGLYLQKIILFGSYARGDYQSDSDVDLMILLDISDMEIKAYSQQLSYMTYDFNLDNDIDIKPIAKSQMHFNRWSENYPFYASIRKEGIVLYGKS